MSNSRRFYRSANFILYGIALILPYFVLEMSFSVMRQTPVSFGTYAWIIAPYIWFMIHGTLITSGNRASWITFSLLYIPASLFAYRYINTSFTKLFLFSPAAVIIAGLILFRIFNRIFQVIFRTDREPSISVSFDPEQKQD